MILKYKEQNKALKYLLYKERITMFINLSNHPNNLWSKQQMNAASKYGKIIDMIFPNISADYTEQEIDLLSNKYFDDIIRLNPSCVMCQGEFSFVYSLVSKLKKAGIKVVAACSERNVEYIKNEEEVSSKKVIFKFIKFREYV